MNKTVEEITADIVTAYLSTAYGAELASKGCANLEQVGKRVAAMYEVIHGSVTRSESWRKTGGKAGQ